MCSSINDTSQKQAKAQTRCVRGWFPGLLCRQLFLVHAPGWLLRKNAGTPSSITVCCTWRVPVENMPVIYKPNGQGGFSKIEGILFRVIQSDWNPWYISLHSNKDLIAITSAIIKINAKIFHKRRNGSVAEMWRVLQVAKAILASAPWNSLKLCVKVTPSRAASGELQA